MNKTLAIVVTSPPHNNFTATAINFAEQALLADNVTLLGVFFYQDGVLNSSSIVNLPNDELQSCTAWQRLNSIYQLPLYLCITAAEKRGLTDEVTTQDNTDIIKGSQ